MATAYVQTRLDEYGEDPVGAESVGEFDHLAADYGDLASQLLA